MRVLAEVFATAESSHWQHLDTLTEIVCKCGNAPLKQALMRTWSRVKHSPAFKGVAVIWLLDFPFSPMTISLKAGALGPFEPRPQRAQNGPS